MFHPQMVVLYAVRMPSHKTPGRKAAGSARAGEILCRWQADGLPSSMYIYIYIIIILIIYIISIIYIIIIIYIYIYFYDDIIYI